MNELTDIFKRQLKEVTSLCELREAVTSSSLASFSKSEWTNDTESDIYYYQLCIKLNKGPTISHCKAISQGLIDTLDEIRGDALDFWQNEVAVLMARRLIEIFSDDNTQQERLNGRN